MTYRCPKGAAWALKGDQRRGTHRDQTSMVRVRYASGKQHSFRGSARMVRQILKTAFVAKAYKNLKKTLVLRTRTYGGSKLQDGLISENVQKP